MHCPGPAASGDSKNLNPATFYPISECSHFHCKYFILQPTGDWKALNAITPHF